MHALTSIVDPDELIRVVFDSLRERICVLDQSGAIVMTNQAWDRFAIENGANPNRCGPGVNYLRTCRASTGPFSEGAYEAAAGIEGVLWGVRQEFTLDYTCPSPLRKAWCRLVARPLGQPHSGAILLHVETTSQVLLATKLRQAQAQSSALSENPVDVATVLAADGSIRFQSPASHGVLGVPPEELIGRPIFEFVHPGDTDAIRRLLRACLRYPSRKHPALYRFRNRDGSWRMMEGIARKIASQPEGGVILNSRDITHRRLAEQTLLAKQDALVRERDELSALAARLFREREEERRRVAVELNSNIGRRLASVSLQTAHLRAQAAGAGRSQGLEDSLAGVGRDIHQLGDGLYPSMLDTLGLAVALRDYCTEFARKEGIPVNYVHRGLSIRLPGYTASILYRIAEDALANVAQHAHANRAWVTLSRTAKGIRLAIRDDGAGFDAAAAALGSGLGIVAMRQRVRAERGSLTIQSSPGEGTEVVALVPLLAARNQPRAAVASKVVVDPLGQH
jgi:PAS domain S-box-containing protein